MLVILKVYSGFIVIDIIFFLYCEKILSHIMQLLTKGPRYRSTVHSQLVHIVLISLVLLPTFLGNLEQTSLLQLLVSIITLYGVNFPLESSTYINKYYL